jgi:hypothetical protein
MYEANVVAARAYFIRTLCCTLSSTKGRGTIGETDCSFERPVTAKLTADTGDQRNTISAVMGH